MDPPAANTQHGHGAYVPHFTLHVRLAWKWALHPAVQYKADPALPSLSQKPPLVNDSDQHLHAEVTSQCRTVVQVIALQAMTLQSTLPQQKEM